jgi:hypothetical protein
MLFSRELTLSLKKLTAYLIINENKIYIDYWVY